MAKVLLAGAGGKLGVEVLAELRRKGYTTRALVRDAARFNGPADEVFTADARDPRALQGACDGVAVVVSALGASLQLGRTKSGGTFQEVDYQANKNLLAVAQKAGVEKFVYVSLAGAEHLRGVVYVDAHEAFVAELAQRGMAYTVVRPTGFFYIMEEVFKMARRGLVPLMGDGSARTNPIHEKDVARACVAAIRCHEADMSVGGPEIFTRREIAELAGRVLGRKVRFVKLPAGPMRVLMRPVGWFDARWQGFLDFGVVVSTADVIAPSYGTYKLADYFQTLAGRSEQKT
jgi:uncharacterized protein YbjT (DUF2867 family)